MKRDIQILTGQVLAADCRKTIAQATPRELYNAVSKAALDLAADAWKRAPGKRVAYLSAEFLVGRLVYANLLNMGRLGEVQQMLLDAGLSSYYVFSQLREELNLTVSVGVSFNKVFAKLGSDYKKPDATTVISRENYRELLWPLPVTDLLFVGRAAARVLEQYGVHTIGDLAAYDREALGKLLGRQGYPLHDYASGAEHSPVIPAREQPGPKSVGNGLTFPRNLEGWTELRTAVTELSDEVAVRLRKHALKCTTVQVTIRDPNFKDICRQKRLSAPTYVSRDLTDAAMELIRASWNPKAPVRALTITAQNLVEEQDAGEQLNLFAAGAAPRRDRLEKLEKAMDGIRDRFGRDAITAASTVHRDKAEVKEDHRLPPVD